MAKLTSKCQACLALCEDVGELIRYDDGKWSHEFDKEQYEKDERPRPRWYGDGVIYTLIAYGMLTVAVRSSKSFRPYVVRPAKRSAP